jgi:hypothetical protein
MIVYNYTKIQRREKRVYSLFNTTISQQGFSMGMIKTAGGVLAIFTVLGLLFCAMTGKFWYNPLNLANGTAMGYFYMVFVFLPIGLGVGLNSYKIQNYRALDYLKLYLQPKKPVDQHGRVIKLIGYKINSFVERL